MSIFLFLSFVTLGRTFSFENLQWKWFSIQQIKVETERPLKNEQVEAWLPQLKGKNLLFLNSNRIVSAIENQPWVNSVMVKKEFPHALLIKVTTIEPKLILRKNGEAFFLDGTGNLIDKVSAQYRNEWDLPLVHFSEKHAEDWDLKAFYPELEALDRRFPISEVSFGLFPEFSVFLKERRIKVVLEYPRFKQQFSKLEFLLKNPPKMDGPIKQIDLTHPKKAVVSSNLSK